VPVGYLVSVLLAAIPTVVSLAPLRRPSLLARCSWALTMVANEQPFVLLAWLALSTVLLVAQGDLGSPGSWVAVATAALTAIGLLELVRRALLARRVLDEALREGLGRHLTTRLPWAVILLAPFGVAGRGVHRTDDIPYAGGGRRQQLDVYRSGTSGGPVMIYLHGGGFTGGRKSKEGRLLLNRLAADGWLGISADYRLRPEAHFPDQLVDLKRVIAWAREHAAELGADASRVFVAGGSAGAHLSVMAALTQRDASLQPGFEDADTSIAGAVPLYGWFGTVYDDDAVPSTPMAYDATSAPPVMVVHGSHDTLVGVEPARRLVTKLRAESRNPVLYAELPGAQHTFDLFRSIRMELVVAAVREFTASGPANPEAAPPPSADRSR
jgi:acetyl esterase/lipase